MTQQVTQTGTLTLRLGDEGHTRALGRALAPLLGAGDVVALEGGLGAGKTTLARAILETLGAKGPIASPTFTLVQTWALAVPVWHFDLYRLKNARELAELGLEEALDTAITLIEWPGIARDLLPPSTLFVVLAGEGDARHAIITGPQRFIEKLGVLAGRGAHAS
ncbi:MAG TPA: tRNA (adenosine(37)-N6)-threonylcarbamoyltransferase complex ATPase subunit type 1 TsaE [Micropepsaceae bacterium]|nr:tRNA (adenosine(37)-N6)-threonylcarbamoyltransferase complex ATPase subunit type 1 TsaE [Micropepsaceae bacterium]